MIFGILSAVRRPFEANVFGTSTAAARPRSYSAPARVFDESRSRLTSFDSGKPSSTLPGTPTKHNPVGLGIFTSVEGPAHVPATGKDSSGYFGTASPLPNAISHLTPILRPTPPAIPSTAWLAMHPIPHNPTPSTSLRSSFMDSTPSLLASSNRRTSTTGYSSNRSSRSSSSGTLPRSPLSSMRRVSEPEVEVRP
jgi:hypothetical protein